MFRGKGSLAGTYLLVSFTQLYPLVNTTSTMPQALQGLGWGGALVGWMGEGKEGRAVQERWTQARRIPN